ncbi:MAG: hypothetical protein ACYCVY_04830 [Acidiferrobacteraceae bacterium]
MFTVDLLPYRPPPAQGWAPACLAPMVSRARSALMRLYRILADSGRLRLDSRIFTG